MIEGGELDINLEITGPNGEVVISEQRKSDNMHSINAPVEGVYKYCFDNSFSTVASKTVFADLGVDTEDLEWKKHVEQDKFDDDSNAEDLVVCTCDCSVVRDLRKLDCNSLVLGILGYLHAVHQCFLSQGKLLVGTSAWKNRNSTNKLKSLWQK